MEQKEKKVKKEKKKKKKTHSSEKKKLEKIGSNLKFRPSLLVRKQSKDESFFNHYDIGNLLG